MNRKLQKRMMDVVIRRYAAAPGAGYDDEKAQVLGREIEMLRADGVATPETLLQRATPESSPIHDLYEWDDSIAAHEHRISQSRSHINHLIVVVTDSKGNSEAMKAYFSVTRSHATSSTPERRHYVSVTETQTNKTVRDEILQTALRELLSWCRKYQNLGFDEFQAVYALAYETRRHIEFGADEVSA